MARGKHGPRSRTSYPEKHVAALFGNGIAPGRGYTSTTIVVVELEFWRVIQSGGDTHNLGSEMKARFLVMTLCALLLGPVAAHAQNVPARELSRLVDMADVIVFGRITELTDLGLAPPDERHDPTARLIAGRVAVEQSVKGLSGVDFFTFQSVVSATALTPGKISPNSYGILLLQRQGDNIVFVSPRFPMLPTASGARALATNPLDAVIEGIAAALTSSAASTSLKQLAIRQLWNTPRVSAVEGLRSALRDGNETIRLAAVAALLSNDDINVLPEAETILLQGRGSQVTADVRLALQLGLRGLKSQAAEPALTRLLARGDVGTRRAAAIALGQTGSPAAIRALSRALDDEDFEVRFNSAQSLADATKQPLLRTNQEQFREEEIKRVSEWKARLATMGVEQQP